MSSAGIAAGRLRRTLGMSLSTAMAYIYSRMLPHFHLRTRSSLRRAQLHRARASRALFFHYRAIYKNAEKREALRLAIATSRGALNKPAVEAPTTAEIRAYRRTAAI